MQSRLILHALGVVALIVMQGCASEPKPTSGQYGDTLFVTSLPEEHPEGSATNAAATGEGAVVVPEDAVFPTGDYRLAPLDKIEVSVFGVPELTTKAQVSSSGNITLPLIGDVAASGKTPRQLESAIAARLGETYLQSPQVTVSVSDALSQRITVGGAVKNPGVIPITGATTLLQSLALAGGLDRYAEPDGVLVFRYAGGKRMAARFDVAAIGSGSSPDPVVAAGDMIMVDESDSRTALRDVREQLPFASLFLPLLLL